MADFRSCITEAVAKGDIDAEAADVAAEAYDDAYAAAVDTFGPIEADRMAATSSLKRLEAEAIEARRRRQLSVRARRSVLEGVAGLKTRRGYEGVKALGSGGGKPPKDGWTQGGRPPAEGPGSKGAVSARALELLIENKPGLSGAPFPSVEGRYRFLRGKADALMADLIEKFETRTGFDRPGRATLDNVVREAFGQDTGDAAAKGMAEAWDGAADYLRQAFNAAGGAIGKLEKWGLPQRHDGIRVRAMGRDGWVDAVLPRLDRARMTDRMTGQPFTERRLKAVLGEVWDSIATGGASRREPGEALGQGMLAKRRGEERFLVFRSAEDWLAYQTDFGEADAFQAMMGHLDDMARDVAQMQVLGPNPAAQFDWLKRFALREAALEEGQGLEGALDRAKGNVLTATEMLAHFTGEAATPVNTRLSAAGVTVRSYLTGVTLGSAIVSDLPSAPYFGRMARSFSGLSRTGDMGELVRLIADPAERAIARRSGFIIEQATDGFVRAIGDNLRLLSVGDRTRGPVNAFARRLPAATMRMQLLTPYVAARKRAFRFEFMGALNDVRDRRLADLKTGDARDRALAAWLDARGFDEQAWGVIRSTPAWSPRAGAAMLRPSDVPDPELAARLGEGIEMETRFVSPETSLWTRAKLIGAQRPGTWRGEYFRSWAMFRGFTMTATHLYAEEMALRGMKAGGGPGALMTAGFAAGALIHLTIAGAVSIQLREMIKGNDPRRMDESRFWGAAALQGGGFGIFGDFLYAAQARNGQTAPAASYGPVGQVASDVGSLTVGNIGQIAEGLDKGESLGDAIEGANVGRDVSNVARRYAPMATVWWMRAAYSRLVADTIQKALDPEAEEAFERRRKRMERETGQQEWWRAGEVAPTRGPDLSNVAAEPVS